MSDGLSPDFGNLAAAPTSVAPLDPQLPPIPVATSVRSIDNSSSILINPDPQDQIVWGKSDLHCAVDVGFADVRAANGTTRTLLMDVLWPVEAGPHPLVIFLTGGGFAISPKANGLALRTYLAEQGFVVASIEYRTVVDGANFRDGVADVKSAIRFLRANALRYHLDSARVALWGESAGGYLATMAALTDGITAFDEGAFLEESSTVQAVIDKFGPSDAAHLVEDFNPEMAAMIGPGSPIRAYLSEGGDAFPEAANPLNYIKSSAPPFLIMTGDQDKLVSPSQTLRLHNALTEAGVPNWRYVLVGADHGDLGWLGDPIAGLPWSTNETMGIMVEFLKRHCC